MGEITSLIENASTLANSALKSTAEEFLQLAEQNVAILSNESGKIGSFRITGRLAEIQATGEVIIVGDLHGDLKSLVYILENSKYLDKIKNRKNVLLIFLGDYGDRGVNSPEVYYIVMKMKSLFPENVIMMRGNHEGPMDLMASPHDLLRILTNKFGKSGREIYGKIRELFNYLYIGVLIKERCILLHGGFPTKATGINDIAYANIKHPHEPHLEEILWNDPSNEIKGTIASPRGAGRLFGGDITNKNLKMLKVKALIRGHQSPLEGYKTDHNQKVITIFSRKGTPYFNRYGAYLHFNFSSETEKQKPITHWVHQF